MTSVTTSQAGRNRQLASIIAGKRVTATPAGRASSLNPADLGDVVATVELASSQTFVDACRAARHAQPEWAEVPAPIRGRVIERIGRLVEANADALAALITREIGKPYPESLGEVQEIIDTCSFFLSEGRRLYGQTVPSEMPDKQLFTFRCPLGVVAVITAANFPAAVPSWYLVPALLAGNTVVWKPSELAPAVADALTALFLHAGLPPGALNLVHADPENSFAGLTAALDTKLVDKVGFTGSTAAGRQISELCGKHLQIPCLELGGKNPLVVMDDADVDLAISGALFSGFATAGQRCTSLGTVWAQRRVHDEFVRRLTVAVEAAVVGDPTKDVLYGPLIAERYLDRFASFLDMTQSHHTLAGSGDVGRITSSSPRRGFVGDPDKGLYCHPTLVVGIRPDDELYRMETFGPVVGVGVFDTLAEAIELANGTGYGLTAAIYTTDIPTAFRFRNASTAGMVSVNNSTVGAEAHLPFGGNGLSGNGSRQSGPWMLEQVTRWQAVNWDYRGQLQRAQMDIQTLPADLDYRLV